MSDRGQSSSGGPLRLFTPGAVVIIFALVMTACIVGWSHGKFGKLDGK